MDQVGQDIESLCGKCGDVWHVVVALSGRRVVRVQCKQCGGYHRHRPPGATAPTKPRASGGRKKATKKRAGPEVDLDPARPPQDYSPTGRFDVGDTLHHTRFGQGVVQKVVAPGKIEVWFDEGPKLLVMGR